LFDISSDEILQLNDVDLRELVGRLCEAELAARGLSPAAVTWGGSQTAADGGLDVRVALPPNTQIEGYIPRHSTGFQVKKPDMPRGAIIDEMRPAGVIRPAIQRLADEAGAYIIVSSTGSTADSALQNRQDALREALDGVSSTDRLFTDFYDRTRLASWVRCHPGLISWVKEKLGRTYVGWRSYGAWSGTAEDVEAEYLLDDKLRLHLGSHRNAPAQSVASAIDELRDDLAQGGKIVRLVGLSGVGKTRLAQALFDSRIGSRPLPPSLAIYTNLSDNPDPQPTGLASDLIANRTRAVFIVDNCPPELHRRLSELCGGQNSTVSVLTIEYDVRDDQPEGTQVVTLDTSSPELIETLLRRRFTYLSQVDAHTIAEASGGNARIAVALAETVDRSDTISGLSNEELFQRLFRQRQDPDNALLLAAQACSLVYSFQGDALAGEEAELPRLAALAGQTAIEIFRHVRELLRRDLVQQRGNWRAVLPHAIANRLAARALEETPYALINQQLVEGGTERLARSFSRRLSFLHNQPSAVAIVEMWFAPGGLLHDVAAFNELHRVMFNNVAPVLPETVLAALERVGERGLDVATAVWRQHLSLLRSLAYDPSLFERCGHVLSRTATQAGDNGAAKEASDAFDSLFPICLSGTHATIEQRLGVIERLLVSGESRERSLGLRALDTVLKTSNFSGRYPFEFGSRSRDFGFYPQSSDESSHWFRAALTFIERLMPTDERLKLELRDLVAKNFSGLWASTDTYDELERLSRTFAADGFWREGWFACRFTLRFDRGHPGSEAESRLIALEAELRPSDLAAQVRAVALSDGSVTLDLDELEDEDDIVGASERLEARARELGEAVAVADTVFAQLIPDMLRGGIRTWTFGRGLAAASAQPLAAWARLVEGLGRLAPEQRNARVLGGFLAELWQCDRELAQRILDATFDEPVLLPFIVELQTAVEIDERGMARLQRAVSAESVPIWMFRYLAFGGVAAHLPGDPFKALLLRIADRPDGYRVALEILYMRFHSDRSGHRQYDPELIAAGRELLRRIVFPTNMQGKVHEFADVVNVCLAGIDAGPVAAEVAVRLRQAVANHETYSFSNEELLAALLEAQPTVVLEALFSGSEEDQQAGLRVFEHLNDRRSKNPADAISRDALIVWCNSAPAVRYPLASSIITFNSPVGESAHWIWSEQAKALLIGAPNPERVLATFIERLRPSSWTGSRAAQMEANARLLDDVGELVPSLLQLAMAAKSQLMQDVARERLRETERDRIENERFE
jgi:hypothetical protein